MKPSSGLRGRGSLSSGGRAGLLESHRCRPFLLVYHHGHRALAIDPAIAPTAYLVMSGSTALASASKLGDLLAQLPLNPPNQWPEIEHTAQSLD